MIMRTPRLVSGDPTKAGQTVEYRVKLTNKTTNAVSFESVNYNLNNTAGCQWRNAEPNVVQECYIGFLKKKAEGYLDPTSSSPSRRTSVVSGCFIRASRAI